MTYSLTTDHKIKGAIFGLLIGDALGVPYEFKRPNEIPKNICFDPTSDFERSHKDVPPGTWSDDGAHALIFLESLLRCQKLDVEDLGKGLVRWYDEGYFAVDNIVFDVGVQTSSAILSIKSGSKAVDAGGEDPHAKGNGSLMRVLPLALWHRGNDKQLVKYARLQSRVTHGNVCCQICCALYCLWARYIFFEKRNPWQQAVKSLRKICRKDKDGLEQLEYYIRPDDFTRGMGTGYVIDTIRSARCVLKEENYQNVVQKAIRLGHDTDTTAAVAGGLAGLRGGFEQIPEAWYENLRGKDMVWPLVSKLTQVAK